MTTKVPKLEGASLRYCVEIAHPVDGTTKVWDSYTDLAKAESIAATLKRYGIAAQVRREVTP